MSSQIKEATDHRRNEIAEFNHSRNQDQPRQLCDRADFARGRTGSHPDSDYAVYHPDSPPTRPCWYRNGHWPRRGAKRWKTVVLETLDRSHDVNHNWTLHKAYVHSFREVEFAPGSGSETDQGSFVEIIVRGTLLHTKRGFRWQERSGSQGRQGRSRHFLINPFRLRDSASLFNQPLPENGSRTFRWGDYTKCSI